MYLTQSLLSFFASTFNLQVIANWRLARHAQSRYLHKLLSTHSVDCVLDVGANTGQYHDYLRNEVEFNGTILSFEPNPACHEILKHKSRKDKKWHIFRKALGNSIGVVNFNIMKDSQFSSFLDPIEKNFANSANVIERTIPVSTETLDSLYLALVEKFQIERPFLKLDTQGYDLEVIKGAFGVIKNFCAIQTEISNIPIYKTIPTLPETLEFFKSCHFQLGTMFPTNPEQFPVAIDFDAYFVSTLIKNQH